MFNTVFISVHISFLTFQIPVFQIFENQIHHKSQINIKISKIK